MSKKSGTHVTDFLFDIAQVVEGALAADDKKVRAYANRLRERLAALGEDAAARRLERALGKRSARPVGLSRAGSSLPVDAESRLPLADVEEVPVLDADPVLTPEVAGSIGRFLRYVDGADKLASRGVAISPSLLLYGPPGCGKTLLARFVARELGLPLVVARTDALISAYLGSTAKNVRFLFEHAMSKPCVLFLDEFDALGKMRDDARELGELKRVVISLLQNIDALGADHVLIAATNHEHLLDPAIWRRFAHKLALGLPAEREREQMLLQFLDELIDREALRPLARVTRELSGADLREVCNEVIREAVLDGEDHVSLPSFLAALGRCRHEGANWHTMSTQDRVVLLSQEYDGVTQAQIADLTGVTQGHVSKILRKVRKTDGR